MKSILYSLMVAIALPFVGCASDMGEEEGAEGNTDALANPDEDEDLRWAKENGFGSIIFMATCVSVGEDGSVIVGKIRENSKYGFGYNAQTGEFGDLMAQGVIDPVKVVRHALQDASSVASLLITTEAMVAELPKKEQAPPAMPGGGGGMGGMDF